MIYTCDYDASVIPAMPVVEIKIGRSLATPALMLRALNEVIIGRDILNQFIVTLNGLASLTEISQ